MNELFGAEPVVKVGVMAANEPRLRAMGDGTTVVDDVEIGVNFHWSQKMQLRFAGDTYLIDEEDANGVLTGRKVVINEVPVEEYLRSVISSEMSANASPALLRAHAVISRSWLLRQIFNPSPHVQAASERLFMATLPLGECVPELEKWYDREDHRQFHVCADDHCQRYQGVTRITSPEALAAVDDTRGMVLTFAGEICDARFSKCCGGVTELFENCWDDAERHPYLASFADVMPGGNHAVCETADRRALAQVLNDFDLETPDFFSWTVTYTPQELSEIVATRSGRDFGTILSLEPLHRGPSGRITRLLVTGTKLKMIVGKELEIRRWLSNSHLYSSAFTVERDAEGRFVLNGRGWGHGVGLCQIGAAMMGASGYDYRQILSHYYPGAELTRLY